MNMALETQNHTGNKKSSPDKNIPQFYSGTRSSNKIINTN